MISALLWIREKQSQFSPVNQAEILDALVDGVMEKLSEAKDRSKIDSTIKRHYLAALSEHLHYSGFKHISSLELEKFTVSYFQSKGFPSPATPFLEDLKAKGILLEVGEEVSFMFEAIRAFFLSTRLHENQDLLDKALSREHFIELGEELDYYTGRHRDQSYVLRKAMELVANFRDSCEVVRSLDDFDHIRSGTPAVSQEGARQLHLAARSRPSADERNAILDSLDERAQRNVIEVGVTKRKYVETSLGKYMEALRIGSSILRNSELVSDLRLKETGYDQMTEGWCQILITVMFALESEGADAGEFGDALNDPMLGYLQGALPVDNPAMASYLRRLIIPNVIFTNALDSIGTSKLQLVMEAHSKANKSTIQQLLDVFLLVDLRVPKWVESLERLLKKQHKNRYVSELIFTKLFQIYMFGRLRPADETRVKGMLAEAVTLVTAVRQKNEKTRAKGNFLRNLEKKRLSRR